MDKVHPKFDALVDRLVYKMQRSQTPVPGFIVGLSGTDSIVAFALCRIAASRLGVTVDVEQNVHGIHFVDKIPTKSWFVREILPWLRDTFGYRETITAYHLERFNDENRWARLHEEAKKWNAWTVGTMNLTEKHLGKYSLLSTAVSIQPIQTLWKSDIIEICEALGVPKIAMENSRIPDCLCGRDDFAAQNIELIDAVLKNDSRAMLDYNLDSVTKAIDYVKLCKSENGFRDRVPYTI